MTYFCPACWREIAARISTCPHCESDLIAADAQPLAQKLRLALNHPEPQTAVRAAWILGERREYEAVDDLILTLRAARDSFLAEAAAEALGKLGDPRATEPLTYAAESGTIRVRRAARRAMRQLQTQLKVHKEFVEGKPT